MAAAVAFYARSGGGRAAPVATFLVVMALAACGSQPPGETQDDHPHDFYVLALSWSPSYCAAEGASANRRQCGARPGHGYVVHGLWPQFEEGWPEFCEPGSQEWVADAIVEEMIDIMPSPGLIGHQWRKHGSCSGLPQEDYFALTRAAFERVTLPEPQGTRISPTELADALSAANRGLEDDAFAVTCDARYVRELRICMQQDLAFRPCPEVAARGCALEEAGMPAIPR